MHGNGSIGFGSGTVIHSTPEESLILTCAHIFKLERGATPPPARFPQKITVDLFDGKLQGQQVHYTETFVGEAIDYDFSLDVGLIRIRPGRRLPYAKVVPTRWKPQTRMGMYTVGCSEGHDATAWDTMIVNPSMRGIHKGYEAIECTTAPRQGRSGGGLYTWEGYIAGVCDFAEPQGNHGLYAAPSSIYKILDRNDLTALYVPNQGRGKALLAKNRSARDRGSEEFRLQSPDRNDPGAVSLPAPGMFGIKPPITAEADVRTTSPRRSAWLPTPPPQTADLKMDPASDPDTFGSIELPQQVEVDERPRPANTSARPWRASRAPLPGLASAVAK